MRKPWHIEPQPKTLRTTSSSQVIPVHGMNLGRILIVASSSIVPNHEVSVHMEVTLQSSDKVADAEWSQKDREQSPRMGVYF